MNAGALCSALSMVVAACAPAPFDKVGDRAPAAISVSLAPQVPRTADAIVASVQGGADPDGDPVTFTYQWSRDGELVEDLTEGTVAAIHTARDQRWDVIVVATDGLLSSPPAEATITVADTAPVVTVTVTPAAPTTLDALEATGTWTDVDGDVVSTSWSWTDGTRTVTGGPRLEATETAHQQVWTATLTADDGTLLGSGAAAVRIANLPPTAADATLSPPTPDVATGIDATAVTDDLDGDEVSLTWEWLVDGIVVQTGALAHLDGEWVERGQTVTATATPHDGFDAGSPASTGAVTIVNAPPTIAAVSLEPAVFDARAPISCRVEGATDPDGDAVTVVRSWTVDGAAAGTGRDLQPEQFSRGQEVTCAATPSDAESSGPTVTSAPGVVANAPPSLGGATLVPDPPVAGLDVAVALGTWSDADGDPVGVRYAWEVDGLPAGSAPILGGDALQRGARVTVEVTPDDGLDLGEPVRVGPAQVANGAPTAPEIAVTSSPVPGQDDLVCEVVGEGTDPDGDPLTHSLTWTVDGVSWPFATGEAGRSTVATTDLVAGQQWVCSATADDDRGAASPVVTAQAVVSPLAWVWTADDGTRIRRDDPAHPSMSGNPVFDGSGTAVFGARGEVIGLQVLALAGDDDADVSLEVTDLVHAPSGSRLNYRPPAPDPTDTVGRPIQLFAQHYLTVQTPTDAPWLTHPADPGAPADMTGAQPGPLVPEHATAGRGGFPVEARAGEVQGFWVDLFLGRDLAAGDYTGSLRVVADGAATSRPLTVTVLDLDLPDTPSWHVLLVHDPAQVVERHGADLGDRYRRFAHRHRVELVTAYDVQSATAALPAFTGDAYLPAEGYDGPGVGVGDWLVPRTLGPDPVFDDPVTAAAEAQTWMAWLEGEVPDAITFVTPVVAPTVVDHGEVIAVADAIDGSAPPGDTLPVLVDAASTPALAGAADIWVAPSAALDPQQVAADLAAGVPTWTADGQRPHTGVLVLDAPPTDARVQAWAAFAHQLPLYRVWHATHWRHGDDARPGHPPLQDVWTDPATHVTVAGHGNGDGVLIYPGEDLIFPGSDRGVAGPVGSLRLAGLRRGAQDHQYLTLAASAGHDALVAELLGEIVPAVYADAGATVAFPETAEAFEDARWRLATALTAP